MIVASKTWTSVMSADPEVPPDERRSAQLMSGLLLVLMVAGFASNLVQLALIADFWPTFLEIMVALAVLGGRTC